MIEGNGRVGYTLICDGCGEECDELFDSFMDSVEYKKDKDNGWYSKQDENGEWNDYCPDCSEDLGLKRLGKGDLLDE
jgi:hypothetical protein